MFQGTGHSTPGLTNQGELEGNSFVEKLPPSSFFPSFSPSVLPSSLPLLSFAAHSLDTGNILKYRACPGVAPWVIRLILKSICIMCILYHI